MMSAQHTPGPWWHSGLEVGTVPMMMVKVANVSGANYEEAKANARLIAAAPDLLEALNALVAAHGSILDLRESDELKLARAAIAKATESA